MMDVKTVGKKYNKRLDVIEIAKLIKKDVKRYFPQIKVSVQTRRYTGGRSIDIKITQLPFNPYKEEFIKNYDNWNSYSLEKYGNRGDVQYRYTQEYLNLKQGVRNIMDSYNYDNSDTMTDYFDVNFYGDVTLDYDVGQRFLGK